MFRILVVDDDKNTRRLMRAVLEDAHYEVETAADGADALRVMDAFISGAGRSRASRLVSRAVEDSGLLLKGESRR